MSRIDGIAFTENQDAVNKTRQPLNQCPECGMKPKIKTSFKGRPPYKNKRKTQYCSCGWSRIIPTEREALIELGLI